MVGICCCDVVKGGGRNGFAGEVQEKKWGNGKDFFVPEKDL
jgi:hypothetical protein